jgi:hypothetical protein
MILLVLISFVGGFNIATSFPVTVGFGDRELLTLEVTNLEDVYNVTAE